MLVGFANALLLTGDQKYLNLWRGMIDRVNANAKVVGGQMLYPHMYGDQGLVRLHQEFAPAALEYYLLSMDRGVIDLLPSRPRWIGFLDGEDPSYPISSSRAFMASAKLPKRAISILASGLMSRRGTARNRISSSSS